MNPFIQTLFRIRKIVGDAIERFQVNCPHKNVQKKYGANTGNYDPSADCYWTNFRCFDCEKRWREEGSK